MATVNYQLLVDKPRVKVILWETLTETNADGEPFVFSGFYPDKCVQVVGNFGGGNVDIQGTNMLTSPTYALLHDHTASGDCQLAAAGFKQVLECPYAIRPYISSGTGVDVDVYMILRKF